MGAVIEWSAWGYPCDAEWILVHSCASSYTPKHPKHEHLKWYMASIVPRHLQTAVVGVHGSDCVCGVYSCGVPVSYGEVVEASYRLWQLLVEVSELGLVSGFFFIRAL